jgi:hypothetical protein
LGYAAAVLQEVQRDVTEDDAAGFAYLGEGAEGNKPIARAHIEQSVTLGQAGVAEDTVAHRV